MGERVYSHLTFHELYEIFWPYTNPPSKMGNPVRSLHSGGQEVAPHAKRMPFHIACQDPDAWEEFCNRLCEIFNQEVNNHTEYTSLDGNLREDFWDEATRIAFFRKHKGKLDFYPDGDLPREIIQYLESGNKTDGRVRDYAKWIIRYSQKNGRPTNIFAEAERKVLKYHNNKISLDDPIQTKTKDDNEATLLDIIEGGQSPEEKVLADCDRRVRDAARDRDLISLSRELPIKPNELEVLQKSLPYFRKENERKGAVTQVARDLGLKRSGVDSRISRALHWLVLALAAEHKGWTLPSLAKHLSFLNKGDLTREKAKKFLSQYEKDGPQQGSDLHHSNLQTGKRKAADKKRIIGSPTPEAPKAETRPRGPQNPKHEEVKAHARHPQNPEPNQAKQLRPPVA